MMQPAQPGWINAASGNRQRVEEPTVRTLLQQTANGKPLMQTFIVDHYIEQGINQRLDQRQHLGEATALLRLIERQMDRSFGPPSDSVRERVLAADSDTLLERLDRILVAKSVEAVLQ